jgi:hypothetical protein
LLDRDEEGNWSHSDCHPEDNRVPSVSGHLPSMELAMRYRWFWYVSLPKLQALEAQSSGRFSLLERLSTALEINIAHLKASLKYKAKSRPWGLNRRLNRLESRMQPLPEANTAFTLKSKFFQFNGIAGKFIQAKGGFMVRNLRDNPEKIFIQKELS